jgi:signal transduction histidine kinase
LKLWEADALDQAGWVLSRLKNYPLSLQYFLEAIRIAENPACEKNIWLPGLFAMDKNPHTARITVLGFIYNDMSQLYQSIGNDEKELSYILQSMKVGESINNYTLLTTVSGNLAKQYLKINKLDSASFFAQQAIAYMDKTGYKTYKGYSYTVLGYVYMRKNNYNLARQHFERAVLENQQQNNRADLAYSYLCLADLFKVSGNTDSSIFYTKKAMAGYHDMGLSADVNKCYSSLYSLYKLSGNSDSAFRYIQVHKALNDSLNEVEKIKINDYLNVDFNEKIKMQELQNERTLKESRTRTYILLSGIGVFMVIAFLLYINNRNRRKANDLLQKQKEEIEIQKGNVEKTLSDLKSTQAQLIQSEKMASLGELTAGIAHEIQNPLNFVNNFSEVSAELVDEIQDIRRKTQDRATANEEDEILEDIRQNLEKITLHGKRADAIVKGMLEHSKRGSGQKEPTDLNALADDFLRLTYQSFLAKDPNFKVELQTNLDPDLPKVSVIPQDIGKVLLNLYSNAFYAVSSVENPMVTVSSSLLEGGIDSPDKSGGVKISVSDNGPGIPNAIKDKIFQPFFTTKPTGQGTGLGLSLSYDIVKAHGGEIKVNTKENEGTEFIIKLPFAS